MLLAGLFGELKAHPEGGETLLDRTMVLYGSNMGNANTHVTTNLPTLSFVEIIPTKSIGLS